jgi:hypothetical protein
MPPTELVQVWWSHMWSSQIVATQVVANRAAAWAWQQAMTTLAEREQAAADAELKACIQLLDINGCPDRWIDMLRAARRPKPQTQAERGLSVLDACGDNIGPANEQELRAALLRLQELEQAASPTTTETTHD